MLSLLLSLLHSLQSRGALHFNMYSLYVKEHNHTGLKYLGQTKQNPDKYRGSGKYWKRHIKKYGNNHSTYVIGTFDTKDDVKKFGQYYSQIWNVVESNEWANLCEENGIGGFDHIKKPWNKGKSWPVEIKQKISQSRKGQSNHKKGCKSPKTSAALMGHIVSMETRNKISETLKQRALQ